MPLTNRSRDAATAGVGRAGWFTMDSTGAHALGYSPPASACSEMLVCGRQPFSALSSVPMLVCCCCRCRALMVCTSFSACCDIVTFSATECVRVRQPFASSLARILADVAGTHTTRLSKCAGWNLRQRQVLSVCLFNLKVSLLESQLCTFITGSADPPD